MMRYEKIPFVVAVIVVVFSVGARLLLPFVTTEYSRMALHLLPFLMPYALFICLIGVIGAILNSRRVFFLPALGALLLNLFLIGGLAAGFLKRLPEEAAVTAPQIFFRIIDRDDDGNERFPTGLIDFTCRQHAATLSPGNSGGGYFKLVHFLHYIPIEAVCKCSPKTFFFF